MDVEEVVDRETFQEYLLTIPQKQRGMISRKLAFFAAARVLPIAINPSLTEDWAQQRKVTPLSTFGAVAISGLAYELPSLTIENGAADDIYANHVNSGQPAVYVAAYASPETANHPSYLQLVADAVASAVEAARLVNVDLWPSIRSDLSGQDALWENGVPDSINALWRAAVARMTADRLDWSIWLEWYDKITSGRGWHPTAMGAVLATVQPEDWAKGPEHINPMFDEVLALYRAEDSSVKSGSASLSTSYPVDFTFDTLHRVMRMIGIDDNMKHLRDPSIVQAFLDDAEQLRDDFKDFADYANELAPGGNYAGVLRRASEKVIKEFDRVEDFTHLRAERLVQLGGELELFANSEAGRDDLREPLASILDKRIGALKQLCRKHFGPSYQTLAPLAELSLDQIDKDGVLHVLDEAIRLIEALPKDDFQPLDHEGLLVLNDMRDELRTYRAAIAEASSDDFRALLEDRFAQSAGSLGLSLLRFGQKSKGALDRAGQSVDAAIKTRKRLEGLSDIIDAIKDVFLNAG